MCFISYHMVCCPSVIPRMSDPQACQQASKRASKQASGQVRKFVCQEDHLAYSPDVVMPTDRTCSVNRQRWRMCHTVSILRFMCTW